MITKVVLESKFSLILCHATFQYSRLPFWISNNIAANPLPPKNRKKYFNVIKTHNIKFTSLTTLKCTIHLHQLHSHCRTTITTILALELFYHKKKKEIPYPLDRNPIPIRQSFSIPTHTPPSSTTNCYGGRICLFCIFHINGTVQFVAIWVWLLSFSLIFSKYIHAVPWINTSFLLRLSNIAWSGETTVVYPPVGGPLGCFTLLAIVNSAAITFPISLLFFLHGIPSRCEVVSYYGFVLHFHTKNILSM